MLTAHTRISHQVHVYYIIELFNVLRPVSCVLYGILDTRNLDSSLHDLLGDIPQSVHNANCICEERVRHFSLPLLQVKFSQPLVRWDLHFLWVSLFIYFIHPNSHDCCMYGSCTLHQISLLSCAWGTTSNIGNIW